MEYLMAKSDGVKDCVKWIEKRIKVKKEILEETDWFYVPDTRIECKAEIEELISVKISLEKYAKKLKHMANEESKY